MPSPDPVSILQRLATNRGAGRPIPAEVAQAAVAWLADAAGPILDGVPPAEALGLQVAPGSRSLSRSYRQSRRDAGLTRLYNFATGSRLDRGERVLEWIEAHQSGDPVPAAAVEALAQVLAAGLPIPANSTSVSRIARARAGLAPVSPGEEGCGTINPEAPPLAANGNRT